MIETRPGVPLERRLADIHARVGELLDRIGPDALAIEELYFGANVRTAFAVGQARGVVLLAAGQRGVRLQLLHAPAGQGRRLRARAGGQGPGGADGRPAARAGAVPTPDHAADALAVAICELNRAPLARAVAAAAMIALVSGEVAVRRADHVVIDCGGVGYRLAVSAETLRHVPAAGLDVTLHAHLVVRDDALALYGFATEEERELFLMLLGVQSVGPKVALAVLSGGPPRELLAALAAGDAPGCRRCRGSASAPPSGSSSSCGRRSGSALPEPAIPVSRSDDPRALAREGLVGLGYSPQEADELLDGAGGERPEELIADALRAARR